MMRCGTRSADTLQRKGAYAPPPGASDILGLEAAGEVIARGAACSRADVALGSRVMALLSGARCSLCCYRAAVYLNGGTLLLSL